MAQAKTALEHLLDDAVVDAKRTGRTGLRWSFFQPRPANIKAKADCAVRAACWATGESYHAVLAEMQALTNQRSSRKQNILLSGTPISVIRTFFEKRGWQWVETPSKKVWAETRIGGSTYTKFVAERRLFKASELPAGLCVAITTRHAVAVEDHVVVDSYDSRGDRSCYLDGYFVKKEQ